jgi:hypothetical protein
MVRSDLMIVWYRGNSRIFAERVIIAPLELRRCRQVWLRDDHNIISPLIIVSTLDYISVRKQALTFRSTKPTSPLPCQNSRKSIMSFSYCHML